MRPLHNVTITLSQNQAAALLYAAEIGDRRIREGGLPGGHRHRDGAMRILARTLEDMRAADRAAGEG